MKYILAILLILLSTYSDIFLFRIGIIPLPPSSFLIPLFLALAGLKYSVIDYIDIFKTHSFKMLGLILFLSIVYAAITKASFTVIIEKISLNAITLLLYLYAVQFFRTESKKIVIFVLVISLFILGGSVLYDFSIGLPKYSKALAGSVRKGGFGENPNQAASGIKFLALAALVYISDTKTLKYFVIIFMLFTVFLTFSRSGLLSVIMILGFGSLNNWHYNFKTTASVLFSRSMKLLILFAVLWISLLALSNVIRNNFPQFTRGEAGKRLDLLTGQSKSNDLQKEAISGGRGDLLISYFEDFMENPLGYGTGYSSDKKANNGKLNTHNYYLYLGVNLGFIALVIYLIYVVYNVKFAYNHDQFYYFIFALLFLLEGFFTHSIFYERPIIICLAFFDSLVYRKNTTVANTKSLKLMSTK
jgi:hypothetical protein